MQRMYVDQWYPEIDFLNKDFEHKIRYRVYFSQPLAHSKF